MEAIVLGKGRKHENWIWGNTAVNNFTGIFQFPEVKGCFPLFFCRKTLGYRVLGKVCFSILDRLKIT